MRILVLLMGLCSALGLPAARASLSFTLNAQGLGEVTEKNWPGQYLLIGIGYISCPDICPTTVMDMAASLEQIGDKASKVTPLFITVDPHRDSLAILDQYVKYFSPHMIGLAGDHDQTRAAMRSLKGIYGYSLKGKPIYPPLPDQYEVFHSAYIYLYGPDRKLIDVYGYGDGIDKIAASLAREIP